MEVARLMKQQLFVSFIALAQAPVSLAEPLRPEVPDQEALEAYKKYWEAFGEYEKILQKKGTAAFRKANERINEIYAHEMRKINKEELADLQAAAEKYRRDLSEHPDSENRPFVLLGLARTLSELARLQDQLEEGEPTSTRGEALGYLRDLENGHPTFPYRQEALYHRALLLEFMEQKDNAMEAWRTLSSTTPASIYTLHAHLAIGDYLFNTARADEALKEYRQGQLQLVGLNTEEQAIESLRVLYRIAWAAFKSADTSTAIEAGTALLKPGRSFRSAAQREKVRFDAIEIVGIGLYESNDFSVSKKVLQRKELQPFAGAIALQLISEYSKNGVDQEILKVANLVLETFPLSREIPDILKLAAASADKLGLSSARIDYLEKLALLLPHDGLWRATHTKDPEVVSQMEALAKEAAKIVANYSYDTGITSGDSKSFEVAVTFYTILLQWDPTNQEHITWRIRRANSQYFVGNLIAADKEYTDLETNIKLDGASLQLVMYQHVLTVEKIWRKSFEEALQKGRDPKNDPEAILKLQAFETAVDAFAQRFPDQARSIDLLLAAANANRDHERFDRASNYWQRVLVSKPTPTQRGFAVRGLVYAQLQAGKIADVMAMVAKFLKLENIKQYGPSLENELKGVLSSATQEEGARLNREGKTAEGGNLLVSVAQEFPDIPSVDQTYRDGAYMLAISGQWADAERAAAKYLRDGFKRLADDMTYLLARAQEYQLKLPEAAATYLLLGKKFPSYQRSPQALARAEDLAQSEGSFIVAGEAAALAGERLPTEDERMEALSRSVQHYIKAEDLGQAEKSAMAMRNQAKSLKHNFKAQILIAKVRYAKGDEQNALDDMDTISKQIERARTRLGESYPPLVAEVQFFLGEEAERRFSDFRLKERSGSIVNLVQEKAKMFEELASRFDKAAAQNQANFSPQARYALAKAAEDFASEISAIPQRNGESLTLKAQTRFNQNIVRLREMAKKYHANNVFAARKNPSPYRNNNWVRKSSLALSGQPTMGTPTEAMQEQVPSSLQSSIPLEWSASHEAK